MDASSDRAGRKESLMFPFGLSYFWGAGDRRVRGFSEPVTATRSPQSSPGLPPLQRPCHPHNLYFLGKTGCFVLLSALNANRRCFGLFFNPYLWITYKFENQYNAKIKAVRSLQVIIYATISIHTSFIQQLTLPIMRIVLEYLFLVFSEVANVRLGVHVAVACGSEQRQEDEASTATCGDRQRCVPFKATGKFWYCNKI